MKQVLMDFGLSNNEVEVYLALIKIGQSTANRVSSLTGIKRSTTYDSLNSLISKGVVSSSSRDSVAHYLAADPKKLVYLLEEKKKRLEKIVPSIEKLKSSSREKSGVVFYEGKRGVITVLNDIFDSNVKKINFVGSRKMAKVPLSFYPDNFVRKRVENNVFIKGFLASEDKSDFFLDESGARKLSKFTYKKELNNSSADMFIYGDKVSFFTNKEDSTGIIISNQEVADFMRVILSMIKP